MLKNSKDMRSLFILLSYYLFTTTHAAIRGISYYGLETERKDLTCTWVKPAEYYINKLYEMGFNHIRLPFSIEYVKDGNWDRMDNFFDIIKKYPIEVTLDAHRIFATHQAYDPTEGGSIQDFIDHWTTILKRYQDHPRLVGVDVFNEYQGTDAGRWNVMLHQIVVALEERFPGRFIYFCGGVAWGGNIHDISLEDLPFRDRILYTLHSYSFSGGQDWDYALGPYVDTGRVSVGEWGFRTDSPEQLEWAKRFIDHMKQRNVTDTHFWTLSQSPDSGALFNDDCITIDQLKYSMIRDYWASSETGNRYLRGHPGL